MFSSYSSSANPLPLLPILLFYPLDISVEGNRGFGLRIPDNYFIWNSVLSEVSYVTSKLIIIKYPPIRLGRTKLILENHT